MHPFTTHTGVVLPLNRADVDTDQIVPKQFLKRVERTGYGRYLFHDWRFNPDGSPRESFVLNRPDFAGASIMVAGRNFGCGSSREHAAWALQDYGIRAVIAPSFADIFQENADQNGIVTVVLDEGTAATIAARAEEDAPYHLTVSLSEGTVHDADGPVATFTMDPFRRSCLIQGLDRIGRTLQQEARIAAFEAARQEVSPPRSEGGPLS